MGPRDRSAAHSLMLWPPHFKASSFDRFFPVSMHTAHTKQRKLPLICLYSEKHTYVRSMVLDPSLSLSLSPLFFFLCRSFCIAIDDVFGFLLFVVVFGHGDERERRFRVFIAFDRRPSQKWNDGCKVNKLPISTAQHSKAQSNVNNMSIDLISGLLLYLFCSFSSRRRAKNEKRPK